MNIPEEKLSKIANDAAASAKALKLVYVNDKQEGIHRVRSGKKFSYKFRNKLLRDKAHLDRIRAMVLPPAWEEVWICALENGHLQATGLDARKRKQYRYHSVWNQLRNEVKFYRLMEFGQALPAIRKQVKKDLALPGLPREKVLATVIALMEATCIRIGNEVYEKLYGSIGLTTMKDKHVEVKGSSLKFCFKGKKGIEHTVSLKNKKLAKIVRQCREIPGKELFQYFNEEGDKQQIDSGMVNDYLRTIIEKDFTAKDFRTWAGTLHSLIAFKEAGGFESESESKSKIVGALDRVAKQLGNTRTVCRKYYVHPEVISLYENGKLFPYLEKLNGNAVIPGRTGLAPIEKLLLQLLRKKKR